MTSEEFRQKRVFALRWTQPEAAEALGLSVAQVRGLEHGRSRVTRTIEILFGMYRPGDQPGMPSGAHRRQDELPTATRGAGSWATGDFD